jgi:hypothetical protein
MKAAAEETISGRGTGRKWETGRRWSAAMAALLLAGLGLGATACGSGSSHASGVPAASGTTATGAPAGGGTQRNALLAYSSCMRSHGVPGFPDPSGNAGVPKPAVVSALRAVGDTRARAATDACANLIPAGGLGGQPNPTLTPQQEQDYLNAAACMRSHGIADFPDPTFSGGHASVSIPSSINTKSTQFTQAAHTCTRLIPAGLPYGPPEG